MCGAHNCAKRQALNTLIWKDRSNCSRVISNGLSLPAPPPPALLESLTSLHTDALRPVRQDRSTKAIFCSIPQHWVGVSAGPVTTSVNHIQKKSSRLEYGVSAALAYSHPRRYGQ